MDLGLVAWISLSLAFAFAFTIAIDEARYPQSMAIMNIVWPFARSGLHGLIRL